jgi:hypothetical protein
MKFINVAEYGVIFPDIYINPHKIEKLRVVTKTTSKKKYTLTEITMPHHIFCVMETPAQIIELIKQQGQA